MKRTLNSQVISIDEVPAERSMGPRRLDVLIVDDERIIADTLATILSRSGYSVKTAYEGITALQLAHAHHPSLVISDVVMPGMSGVELALTLKCTIPECKVLLFSGQAATVDLLDQARRMGHEFAIVTKPVHPTDMLRRVSEYVMPKDTSSCVLAN
jgi:CheY-like chemotaxis protein